MQSACPGCAVVIEHTAEDASAYYGHVSSCPDLQEGFVKTLATDLVDRRKAAVLEAKAIGNAGETLQGAMQVSTFLKILAMIPGIIATVKQVEDTITTPGAGAHKLDVVLNTVNAAVQAVPEVAASLAGQDLKGTVTSIVNATVAGMNAAKPQAAPAQQ